MRFWTTYNHLSLLQCPAAIGGSCSRTPITVHTHHHVACQYSTYGKLLHISVYVCLRHAKAVLYAAVVHTMRNAGVCTLKTSMCPSNAAAKPEVLYHCTTYRHAAGLINATTTSHYTMHSGNSTAAGNPVRPNSAWPCRSVHLELLIPLAGCCSAHLPVEDG